MKKILLYCLFCLMVMVTSGGVTVLLGQDSLRFDTPNSPEEEVPKTPEEIAMGVIMDGAMKIMNGDAINAKGVINVQNGSDTYLINLDVQANLDMQNLAGSKLHAKIDANLFGNDISLDAIYLNQKVYISALNQNIKFQVSTITDTMNILSEYLGFSLGGLEMPALDPSILNDLLTNILLVEHEDATKTVSFNLNAGALIEGLDINVPVSILFSEDNSFLKIQVENLNFEGMNIDVNIDMLSDEFEISANDAAYEDFDYTPKLVSSLLKTFTSDYIDMSGKITAFGLNIDIARLQYNAINKSMAARVNVLGLNANAVCVNNVSYIDLQGTKFKISDTTIDEMLQIIVSQLGLSNLNTIISQDLIFSMLDKIDRIYFSTEQGELCFNAEAFGVTIKIIMSEDEYIKKISLNTQDINGELVFNSVGKSFEITPPSDHYIDMGFLPEVMNAALNTFQLENLSIYGNIGIGNQNINIDKLHLNTKTFAMELSAVMQGYNLDVTHLDDNTYINLLGKKLLLRNQTLQQTIQSILELAVGDSIIKNIDIAALFSDFDRSIDDITYQYIDNKFHLNANIKGFCANVILNEKLQFEYLGGSYQDFSFEFFIDTSNSDLNISKPEGYHIDLGFMPMLIDSMDSIISSKKFAFNANARISGGQNIKDYLYFDMQMLKVDLSHMSDIMFSGDVAVSGDFSMNGGLAFANNTLYLDFAGLKIQMKMTTILETVQKIMSLMQSQGGDSSFDISTIASIVNCLDDVYYTENSISIDIALENQESFTLLICMDSNGQLSKISSNNIVSSIDDSIVEFELQIVEHGNNVVVNVPNSQEYMDFNSLPLIIDAILNTSKLTAFDLKGDFNGTMNGQKYITSSPNIVVNTANGLEIGGNAYIDLIDESAVDYNLGLWLDSNQIHAQINNMKVKLDNTAIPDIIDAAMSLIGSDMNISGVIGMITSLELGKVTAMVKDIVTFKDTDKTTISITLDGSLLYGLADIQTGLMSSDVIIELEINSQNYFSKISVKNIVPGENQSLDFMLYLDNIGSEVGDGATDIKMPDKGDSNSYIDLSGLAPVLQAVKKTADKEYFYITGKIDYPNVVNAIGVFDQDVLLRINRDANNNIRFALTVASDGYRSGSLTNVKEISTMFFENGTMYIRQHNLWKSSIFSPQYTKQEILYEKATMSEFSANPMYYVKLMLQISLLDSFSGSIGGNVIDFTNILTNMHISDTAEKKQVTAGINIQELAGTTALSGFDLNFLINTNMPNEKDNGYLTELSITNFNIIDILGLDLKLYLDLAKVSGNCFDGDNRTDRPVLGVINGTNVYFEGFNKQLWS